jgi:peptidoglycan/xylan/chitin deacetylase (PgdA/CDA1 family)
MRACWSPAQLAAKPDERRIVRGTRTHLMPNASAFSTVRAPIASPWRGSIRRVKLARGERLIALTFDLCENENEIAGYDGAIVDVLRREDVKATFFASGHWLMTHPERAQQLLADPLFEVGSHSFTHRNFRLLAPQAIREDLALADAADASARQSLGSRACYADAAGAAVPPLALFRFPFGTCNADSLNAVHDAGLLAIQWDVVSADPVFANGGDRIARTVVERARPGSIIVMHANGRGHHTAQALPRIIAELRARGFEFATVGDLLARGEPEIATTCYETKPGDNLRYDRLTARASTAPAGANERREAGGETANRSAFED